MGKKQPTDYKSLKAIWYKKLEKSGFKDAESSEDKLKAWSSYKFASPRALRLQFQRTEYYRLAALFLEEYKFKTNIDKVIWEYHANGLSIRNITETLRKARIKRTNRDYVWQTVKKLDLIMKTMYLK